MTTPFVIDNHEHQLGSVLNDLLASTEGKPADIATAYFTVSGYRLAGVHALACVGDNSLKAELQRTELQRTELQRTEVLAGTTMNAIDPDRVMYRWRQLDGKQRREVLEYRKRNRLPWHSPPHYASDTPLYLMTAACYEHRHVIGHTPQRMADFEAELLDTANSDCRKIFAWVVLPNHYHLLVDTVDVKQLLHHLGQLHGRTSHRWNGEQYLRGRKVWFNAAETAMKSERHFWATLNYVLNNAVHHGYVKRWQDWPYSNAETYLAETGRERAEEIWRAFPVLAYGKDWDAAEL